MTIQGGEAFTDPGQRDRGIPLAARIGRAKVIGQPELTVSPGNRRAIVFYQPEGFERIAGYSDAVRMDGTLRDELLYQLRLR